MYIPDFCLPAYTRLVRVENKLVDPWSEVDMNQEQVVRSLDVQAEINS